MADTEQYVITTDTSDRYHVCTACPEFQKGRTKARNNGDRLGQIQELPISEVPARITACSCIEAGH